TDSGTTAPVAPWLAFVSRRTGNMDVFILRSDGTGLRQITTDPAADLAPAWMPDGQHLVFVSTRSGSRALYVHDLATDTDALLPTGVPNPTAPRVSPDGRWVAFEATAAGESSPDVYVVAAAGGTATRLTSDP